MRIKYKITKVNFVKETIIYGLSNALYTGFPLLLMPFVVKILKPEDYGMVELFRSISIVIIPIIGLSTISSVDRYYYDLNKNDFKSFLSSVILFHFVSGSVLISCLLLIGNFISSDYYIFILLSVIYCTFNQVIEIYLITQRIKNKATNFLQVRFLTIFVEVGLIALFYFMYNKLDWTFRVYPSLVTSIVVCIGIITVLYSKGEINIFLNKKLLTSSILFSAPLILHMISGYVINLSNRFFMLEYYGKQDLGVFSLTYQIGMVISFVYTSFHMAWTPTFYKLMRDEKYQLINKIRIYVYIGLAVLALLVYAIWFFFVSGYVAKNGYDIVNRDIVILISSYVILSYYKLEGNYYFFSKETKKLSYYTIISAFVSIILNFILIPNYALLGACISTLLSFVTMYFLVLINKPKYINVE